MLSDLCEEPVRPAASATVSLTVTEYEPFALYVCLTRAVVLVAVVPSPNSHV
jgi:hypothetical protein